MAKFSENKVVSKYRLHPKCTLLKRGIDADSLMLSEVAGALALSRNDSMLEKIKSAK